MKKTKRGVERICVMLLAVILMVESVSMPVKGEIKKNVSTLGEPGEEQISDNSVEKYAEEMVSANFISEEETERAASAAKQEKVDAEMPAEGYSGIDGDLEWTIDSAGFLTVKGEGDFDGTPDWLAYNEEIKYAKVNVQEITSMKPL